MATQANWQNAVGVNQPKSCRRSQQKIKLQISKMIDWQRAKGRVWLWDAAAKRRWLQLRRFTPIWPTWEASDAVMGLSS